MAEPTFDHERLDVHRLAIDQAVFSYQIAQRLGDTHRQARDQWLRAAPSIPLNIAKAIGIQHQNDKNRFFEIARGRTLFPVATAGKNETDVSVRMPARDNRVSSERHPPYPGIPRLLTVTTSETTHQRSTSFSLFG